MASAVIHCNQNLMMLRRLQDLMSTAETYFDPNYDRSSARAGGGPVSAGAGGGRGGDAGEHLYGGSGGIAAPGGDDSDGSSERKGKSGGIGGPIGVERTAASSGPASAGIGAQPTARVPSDPHGPAYFSEGPAPGPRFGPLAPSLPPPTAAALGVVTMGPIGSQGPREDFGPSQRAAAHGPLRNSNTLRPPLASTPAQAPAAAVMQAPPPALPASGAAAPAARDASRSPQPQRPRFGAAPGEARAAIAARPASFVEDLSPRRRGLPPSERSSVADVIPGAAVAAPQAPASAAPPPPPPSRAGPQVPQQGSDDPMASIAPAVTQPNTQLPSALPVVYGPGGERSISYGSSRGPPSYDAWAAPQGSSSLASHADGEAGDAGRLAAAQPPTTVPPSASFAAPSFARSDGSLTLGFSELPAQPAGPQHLPPPLAPPPGAWPAPPGPWQQEPHGAPAASSPWYPSPPWAYHAHHAWLNHGHPYGPPPLASALASPGAAQGVASPQPSPMPVAAPTTTTKLAAAASAALGTCATAGGRQPPTMEAVWQLLESNLPPRAIAAAIAEMMGALAATMPPPQLEQQRQPQPQQQPEQQPVTSTSSFPEQPAVMSASSVAGTDAPSMSTCSSSSGSASSSALIPTSAMHSATDIALPTPALAAATGHTVVRVAGYGAAPAAAPSALAASAETCWEDVEAETVEAPAREGPLRKAGRLLAQSALVVLAGAVGAVAAASSAGAVLARPPGLQRPQSSSPAEGRSQGKPANPAGRRAGNGQWH
ncbi:hypothetical protein HYH03_009583 [Edaphochlamys debaryana]|uniref:Uncharacterized protein n=1 Tax=Edaphochlamys debaryana TaxID=47281 RepID=A0A835XYG9_9CHLO|nr:hypothetical protein HYH03_009583 [Edaphochlamys debaryana]|eukprot:KAG2492089.1 hypothetical protein HYH03_009583 [Edaphochlamys debaryana]